MKQRFILIALFILKYYGLVDVNEMAQWIEFSRQDFEFCPKCFEQQHCDHRFQNVELPSSGLAANMVNIFGSRTLQMAQWKWNNSSLPVVLKYLSNGDVQNRVKEASCRAAKELFGFFGDMKCDSVWKIVTKSKDKNGYFLIDRVLNRVFVSNQWTDGLSLCPNTTKMEDFKRSFNSFSNDATFWIQILVNPELVAMQTFQKIRTLRRFVPNVVDWCGFTIIEEYKGESLYNYYNRPLRTRIYFARQLMDAAIAFSYGVDGFRIYFTDATPDNIVVDPKTLQISFVDLDNLLVVNANSIPSKKIHRNEQIDCDNCFAYVPEELCAHQLSDINIFAMCQIFDQDFFTENTKGLLHSFADELIEDQAELLSNLLNRCIQCDKITDCDNRFAVAEQLLELFNGILGLTHL